MKHSIHLMTAALLLLPAPPVLRAGDCGTSLHVESRTEFYSTFSDMLENVMFDQAAPTDRVAVLHLLDAEPAGLPERHPEGDECSGQLVGVHGGLGRRHRGKPGVVVIVLNPRQPVQRSGSIARGRRA